MPLDGRSSVPRDRSPLSFSSDLVMRALDGELERPVHVGLKKVKIILEVRVELVI